MTTYYMTFHRPSDVGYWLPCKSVNLLLAKREAYIQYKDNYTDGVILLSTIDINYEQYVLAWRKSVPAARWQNYCYGYLPKRVN